eukprot:gene13045-17482_t
MVRYTQLPSCVSYHPNSDLNGRTGFYPNISSEQLFAVNELADMLERLNLLPLFNDDEEHEFLKLLRFLRARQFNVANAFEMIKEDIIWRTSTISSSSIKNINQLRKCCANDVLNCDLEQFHEYFPAWIQGIDKQSRPISYRKFGKFEISKVLKLTSIENLIRFHAWEAEQLLLRMNNLSKQKNINIETFMIVIDAAGWSLKLATRDAFTFIKGMANTDSDHYPERLGSLIVINAPAALAYAYRIIQTFLDPVQKQKINIVGTNPTECLAALQQHIDLSEIPECYGGNAPNLSPIEAINSMNPEQINVNNNTSNHLSNKLQRKETSEMSTQTDENDLLHNTMPLEVEMTSCQLRCIIS